MIRVLMEISQSNHTVCPRFIAMQKNYCSRLGSSGAGRLWKDVL